MIRPMRGVRPTKPLDAFPYLVSFKVDGMRALVIDGTVYSKTMKPIPSPLVQSLFGHLHGFDGELVVGPPHAQDGTDVFERSRGLLMRKSLPDAWVDMRFYVFDRWDQPDEPATKRVPCSQWPGVLVGPGVHVLDHQVVRNVTELDAALREAMELKYEGLMLRSPNGPYKYGTSTEKEGYLLKLKPMQTSSAVIIDVVEQMENTNAATLDNQGYTKRSSAKAGKVGKGTFGAFLVRDLKTGVEFSVGNGPGVTQQVRDDWWARRGALIGQYVYYSYQEVGTKDAPRLPQFLRFRDATDISEVK